VWTSHPGGRFHLQVADASQVKRYRFGTKTADFHICTTCGVVPIVTSEIAGHVYAVVNVNALENVDPAGLDRAAANFEGEAVGSRLSRRERNWIADVRFESAGG